MGRAQSGYNQVKKVRVSVNSQSVHFLNHLVATGAAEQSFRFDSEGSDRPGWEFSMACLTKTAVP